MQFVTQCGKCCRDGETIDDNIMRHIRFVHSATKATNTHSEYVTLICLPREQWFVERASMLRYTYIAFLAD